MNRIGSFRIALTQLLNPSNEAKCQTVGLTRDTSTNRGCPLFVEHKLLDLRLAEVTIFLEGCEIECSLSFLGGFLGDRLFVVQPDQVLQRLDLFGVGSLVPGYLEPRRSENLRDLAIIHSLRKQAVLDGVFLDVLLDSTAGFLGSSVKHVDLGLLTCKVASYDERRME